MAITKPIRTEAENDKAMARIDELWDCAPGSKEADELELLGILVDAFEEKAYPIGPGVPKEPGDPIEYIQHVLKARGMRQQELSEMLGGSGRVSDVLNRRRKLTLGHIRNLTEHLGMSADLLIKPYDLVQ